MRSWTLSFHRFNFVSLPKSCHLLTIYGRRRQVRVFYSFGIFFRYCGDCRGNILSLIFVGSSSLSPLLPGNKKPEGEAGPQRGGLRWHRHGMWSYGIVVSTLLKLLVPPSALGQSLGPQSQPPRFWLLGPRQNSIQLGLFALLCCGNQAVYLPTQFYNTRLAGRRVIVGDWHCRSIISMWLPKVGRVEGD